MSFQHMSSDGAPGPDNDPWAELPWWLRWGILLFLCLPIIVGVLGL